MRPKNNTTGPSWPPLLKAALKAVKKGLRAASFITSALFLPLSVSVTRTKDVKGKTKRNWTISLPSSKVLIYFGLRYVVQPASIFLFPKAENYLKKENLDPQAVERLAPGKDIHIIPDNIFGKTYMLLEYNPVTSPANFLARLSTVVTPEVRGQSLGRNREYLKFWLPEDLERVYIKQNNDFAEANNQELTTRVEAFSGGAYQALPVITGKDWADMSLLHEIRHCGQSGYEDGLYVESDATYSAITELARQKNDTAYISQFSTYEALDSAVNWKYDNVLYNYHLSHGLALPAETDIVAANRESAPMTAYTLRLNNIYLASETDSSFKKKNDQSMKNIEKMWLEEYNALSPLAQLKINLLCEAWQKAVTRKSDGRPARTALDLVTRASSPGS